MKADPPASRRDLRMRRTTSLFLFTLLLTPPVQAEPHWSFRPRSRPTVPTLTEPNDKTGVRSGLDAFVLHRLDAEGLHPAPEADRATLIRRLSFDLTGL